MPAVSFGLSTFTIFKDSVPNINKEIFGTDMLNSIKWSTEAHTLSVYFCYVYSFHYTFIIYTHTHTNTHIYIYVKWKVKKSCNRPSVAQRFQGGLGSQISMTFGTWRWWGYQPHTPAAFTPRKFSLYLFSLGAESTPGPWYGRKEYITEKSSDTTRNWSQDHPTSSTAP
jgi:hypothetical protein